MNEHVRPPSPAEPAPTSAGALDIAMAAADAGGAESPAWRLLEEQRTLVREQVALARNERFRNRIKAARDLAFAAAAVGALTAAAAVLWSARNADGLVTEAFNTPPDLHARALDGAAVSAMLLDRLTYMEARSESARASRTYGNDWGDELSVEIPQTGVSVGEAYRTLRRWLGRETRVSGQIYRNGSGGLTVLVRAAGLPARAARGTEAEFEALLTRAAERLYEQTQPYRYSVYLDQSNRDAEALAIMRRLLTHPSKVERAWAYNGMCSLPAAAPTALEAVRCFSQGLRLEPRNPAILGNLAGYQEYAGLAEASLQTRRRLLALPERERNRYADPRAMAIRMAATEGRALELTADYTGAAAAWETSSTLPENFGHRRAAPYRLANALAWRHEPGRARAMLAELGARDEASAMAGQGSSSLMVAPFATAAEVLDDWPAARDALLAADAALAGQGHGRKLQRPVFLWPRLAYAHARTGRLAEAQALISRTPARCYTCVRARAKIAAVRRDHAAVERWFAEAVRQAASLPFAYSEWGEAKLARGDVDGAIRLFRLAQARGPRWADPLKLEGDALAVLGDHRAAVRRYAEAAQRAPNWGALHLAWGRSLDPMRRNEAARDRYRAAAGMDLRAADRAEVRRRLAAAA